MKGFEMIRLDKTTEIAVCIATSIATVGIGIFNAVQNKRQTDAKVSFYKSKTVKNKDESKEETVPES